MVSKSSEATLQKIPSLQGKKHAAKDGRAIRKPRDSMFVPQRGEKNMTTAAHMGYGAPRLVSKLPEGTLQKRTTLQEKKKQAAQKREGQLGKQ